MRKRLLRLLWSAPLALLFAAGLASAQTTGSVIGVITDASTGKPVAGALVIATSPNLQGEQTAVTDGSGSYRITQLPPGQYKLAVQLEGFKPAERSDISIRLDKTIRANMAVVPEAVQMEEQVVKTGIAPVINVGSAETGTVVSKEFVANVPVGRDFQSTAIVTPGAQVDTYGISFNGATSPENSYILDGQNVTDPAYGVLGSNILTNFVEEVDVKSGSFMPEYGRTTAGIINVVTKSGSNEFHGSVFGNITPGFLSPSGTQVGRNGEAIARETTFNHGGYIADFGAELGGPIMKDKLWFYVGFAPTLHREVSRRYYQAAQQAFNADGTPTLDGNNKPVAKIDPNSGFAVTKELPGTSRYFNDDNNGYQLTSKLTYLFNENHSFTVSFYRAPSDRNYLTNANATESAGMTAYKENPNDLIGRYTGKFLDKHLVIEAQGGWHHQTTESDPKSYTVNGDVINQATTSQVIWQRTHDLQQFTGAIPGCETGAAGFTPCNVTNFWTGGYGFIETLKLDRYSGKVSATYLMELLGHHAWKAGVDIEQSRYDHAKTYSGGAIVRERTNALTASGTYRFQDYRQFGIASDDGSSIDTLGGTYALHVQSITNSRAYYIQDSWSILDTLTLNAGVRWETQDMYKNGSDFKNFNITDSIGPRVQAIWDFTGQGRGKVSANWGRFYEALPLDMGDRSFGGETQVRDYRNCTGVIDPKGDLSHVGGSPRLCPVMVGTASPFGQTYAPYSTPVVPVAPDLKAQYVDMFGGAVEYEILPDLSIGVTYEGRRLGRVIEDMSTNDGVNFFIANPAESKPFLVNAAGDKVVTSCPTNDCTKVDPSGGYSTDAVTGRVYFAKEPAPERKYDGITFEVKKNFSNHWLGQASYTYSSFRGNYPGLFRTENAQLDPNILSEYDLPSLLPNKNGPLPGDKPHQIKLYGAYIWDLTKKLNVTTGAAFRAQSGTPINVLGAHPDYGNGEAFILPRGSGGRTPFNTQLDLLGSVDYVIAAPYTLKFTVSVFNVLNKQETLNVDQNYTFDSVQPIVGGQCSSRNGASSKDPIAGVQADCPDIKYLTTTDGRPVTPNKNYGRPANAPAPTYGYAPPAYQVPLQVRLGVALTF
ncbi:TonB-dependent receptor [Anaeromyxobacter paludicola]|uniref:Membrane protein n=1 Tax=Anaeromyxobacter paludicola TaxID=2918171 RepID=A0ABN6NAX6_9BACT|nr:TonB-dependent receptor [Anaeromyxobacter paludicola]BDG09468.1 membrane protein [Anaeromyxobacter paludicola]